MLLVLLVGQNPLPNWVIFQALRHPEAPDELRPSAILLVHSQQTAGVADRLLREMKEADASARTVLLTDARDGVAIRRDLHTELDQHYPREAVHLNYTGGTKEMAVSAYAELAGGTHKDGLLCSYLDVERHRLRFHGRPMWPGGTADLRAMVDVPLDLLLKLHGRTLKGREPKTRSAPPWPATPLAMWQAMRAPGEGGRLLQQWEGGQFADICGDRLKYGVLRDRGGFSLPAGNLPPGVDAAIRADLRLNSGEDWVTWDQVRITRDDGSKRDIVDESAKFFHGTWLEDWFWLQSREHLSQHSEWPLHHNVKAVPTDAAKGATPSELDVLLICGYQLFVFSCTTDQRLVKEKALEVIHRAQQYGGEEARPIVVAPLEQNQVERHLQDIQSDFGAGSNVRIWGLQELDQLDQTWAGLLSREGLA